MKLNNINSSFYSVLNDSEHLFDVLFNQELQFMAILSPEGRVLKVNDFALASQGAKREDYVGKLFWHSPAWRKLPEWEGIWRQRLIDAAHQQNAIITEDVFEVEDGSLRYADASTQAIFSVDGKVSGYIIQAVDITLRRLQEQQLEESETRMALVFEHSQIGHWEKCT